MFSAKIVLLMQWSTTASLHDLHIVDNANNIVRWHRMSQCSICLQPIPYDERRLIGSKIFHQNCLTCVECQKSLGYGAFEEYQENAYCLQCHKRLTDPKIQNVKTENTNGEQTSIDSESTFSTATVQGSMKAFVERVHLYNEYNPHKTSHLTIDEKNGKIRISGMLRIYWTINTPIKLKSGQSIPLGLYPNSLGIHEFNGDQSNDDNRNDLSSLKNSESNNKRSCYDDTVLSKLSLSDETDAISSSNLRRVQTIRVPSNPRRTYRLALPSFLSSSNDDEEARSFIPGKDSMTTVYIDSETTVRETISLLFSKHFIDESNVSSFTLYKVERRNGNCIAMSDDDYPLVLRILAGPFENDILFYLMEHGKSKTIPLEVSNYLVLPEVMLRAFIEKFNFEEIEHIHMIKRKYLTYKQSLLSQFEMVIAQE